MKKMLVSIFSLVLMAALVACTNPTVVSVQPPPTQPKFVPTPQQEPKTVEPPPPFMAGFDAILEDQQDDFGCVGEVWAGETFIGSGVLIDSRHVLTAAHCCVPEDSCGLLTEFKTRTGSYCVEKIIIHPNNRYPSPRWDMAVLVLDSSVLDIKPAKLADDPSDVVYLDPVRVCGYGGHIRRVSKPLTFFAMGVFENEPSQVHFYPLLGSVWFGDSGGGVFNQDGELIGIVSLRVSKYNILVDCIAANVYAGREWIFQAIQSP